MKALLMNKGHAIRAVLESRDLDILFFWIAASYFSISRMTVTPAEKALASLKECTAVRQQRVWRLEGG